MAITAYADFITGLAALNVDGVVRRYPAPPDSLNTADLPASFVRLPSGDEGAMTFGSHGGWPTLRCEFVVAYQPAAQDTSEANFTGTVAMFDAVADALRGIAPSVLGKGPVTWTLRQELIAIAGIAYWCVVAAVTGRG